MGSASKLEYSKTNHYMEEVDSTDKNKGTTVNKENVDSIEEVRTIKG